MRSLFTKIFLWFWLANTMVVGVLVLATIGTPYGPDRERVRAFAGHLTLLDGERAVATLDRAGIDGLRREIGQLKSDTGVRFFLFNEKGEELLAQPAPAGARDLALLACRSGQTELNQAMNRASLVARRVMGADGRVYVAVTQPPPGPLTELFRSPHIAALRLASVVLMAGVVCYGLARYLTGPLRRLRSSARQLAAGDLTVRVGAGVGNRHDEMGDLGRDFDFMAERVETLISSQRRLIQDMSHELRSPLARLNMALGLAVQRAGPEAKGALDRIEREAHRLNELVGELLTLARLEGSAKTSREEKIDLAALVQEVVADGDFEAQSLGRQVRLLRCDECTTAGSPEVLRSAIENVIRNSIRYTPERAQVDVTLCCENREAGSRAVISVRDHGPGVPEDALKAIFQPFYRVGDDRNPQTGGVGLGLAIVQQAMRLHCGTAVAANASDGGLIVELSLPVTS